MRIKLACLLFLGVLNSKAQTVTTPQPLMKNAILICPEGSKVISVSSSSAIFQFGVIGPERFGPTFVMPASALPLLIDYTKPNLLLAPTDPADGVGKFLYAQQTTTDYKVTWQDSDNITQVKDVPPITTIPPVVVPNSGFMLGLMNFFASFDINLNGVAWHCAVQNGSADPANPKYQLVCIIPQL